MVEVLENIVKVDIPFSGEYYSAYDGKTITIPAAVVEFFKLRQRVSDVGDLVIYYRGHVRDYPIHLEMTDNPPREPMMLPYYKLMSPKRTRNRFNLPKELREELKWKKGTQLVFAGRHDKFNIYTQQDYAAHVKPAMETKYRLRLVSNGGITPST